jgi:hypothetical protein
MEEKTKYFLKIGIISIIVLVLIFILVKYFISKPSPPPPPETFSPEETIIKYFSLEQEGKREEAKKYLSSDLSKVKIFGEEYFNLQRILWAPWKGSLPEYRIKNIQTSEKVAKVNIEITTDRIEALTKENRFHVFFRFDLPRKAIFEIDLVKENDCWKIVKVNLPDLILERKLKEEVEIIENVFIKPIKIEEYSVEGIKPGKGFKFLSLEVEYKNKRAESLGSYFYSFRDWRIIDENKVFYKPVFNPSNPIEISPPVPELGPNESKKIKIFFKVPENIDLKELTFQNLDKKVIFKIDYSLP